MASTGGESIIDRKNGDDAASVERDSDSGRAAEVGVQEVVYRRLHFVHRVPHQYARATSDERIRVVGGTTGIKAAVVKS